MISRMDQPLVLGIIDWSYKYRGRWGRRRRRIEDSNSKKSTDNNHLEQLKFYHKQ